MKRRPRGASIIEALIYITLSAAALTLVVVAFDRLFAVQRSAEEGLNAAMAFDRFGRQFRRDVNLATAVKRVVSPRANNTANTIANTTANDAALDNAIELIGPGTRRVTYAYRPDDSAIRRQEVLDGVERNIESYRLPRRIIVAWNLPDDAAETSEDAASDKPQSGAVSCRIAERSQTADPPVDRFRIEAMLGTDVVDLASPNDVGEMPAGSDSPPASPPPAEADTSLSSDDPAAVIPSPESASDSVQSTNDE